MKIVLSDVVVNQVSSREVEKKDKAGNKTGEIVTYRNVDIFLPSDPDDPFSQAKAITAKVVESPEGFAAFKYLQSKEGQKVSLFGQYQAARSFKNSNFPEEFKIMGVVESIKMVEIKTLKAAA